MKVVKQFFGMSVCISYGRMACWFSWGADVMKALKLFKFLWIVNSFVLIMLWETFSLSLGR